MERTQFTFYRNFHQSIKLLKKPKDQLQAYQAICDYALFGKSPEPGLVSDAVMTVFTLAEPALSTGRCKAASGRVGGISTQAKHQLL